MKLTPAEIEFFKNLAETEVAGGFVSYTERLCNHICDSRNWDELGIKDKEVANSAEKVIRQFVIDRLRLQNKKKKPGSYEYD